MTVLPIRKSCRDPGGYSKGGTGYPFEAPYASASGPVSENTGLDPEHVAFENEHRSEREQRRRIMVPHEKAFGNLRRHQLTTN
jgi:hypothetical protein